MLFLFKFSECSLMNRQGGWRWPQSSITYWGIATDAWFSWHMTHDTQAERCRTHWVERCKTTHDTWMDANVSQFVSFPLRSNYLDSARAGFVRCCKLLRNQYCPQLKPQTKNQKHHLIKTTRSKRPKDAKLWSNVHFWKKSNIKMSTCQLPLHQIFKCVMIRIWKHVISFIQNWIDKHAQGKSSIRKSSVAWRRLQPDGGTNIALKPNRLILFKNINAEFVVVYCWI